MSQARQDLFYYANCADRAVNTFFDVEHVHDCQMLMELLLPLRNIKQLQVANMG